MRGKKTPAKTMTSERLKRVERMGRDLERELNLVRKHMGELMEHIEHAPHASKAPRTRRKT